MKIYAAILALAVPAAAYTIVEISVDCAGANFNQLSVQDVTLVSNSLEDAYNMVHGNTDDDDSTLSNIRRGSNADASLGYYSSYYSGDFNCRLCYHGAADMLTVSSTADTIWGAKFAEALIATNSSTFSTITTCSIRMGPQTFDKKETHVTSKETPSPLKGPQQLSVPSLSRTVTSVSIDPKCQGLNYAKLSVGDVTYAGNALQDAFNKVHGQADNDDSSLDNVHWGKKGGANLGYYSSYYSGDFNCRLCYHSAADLFSIETINPTIKQWENEFLLSLVGSGRPSFKSVTKCNIKMSAKGEEAVVGESTKCGLRACAN